MLALDGYAQWRGFLGSWICGIIAAEMWMESGWINYLVHKCHREIYIRYYRWGCGTFGINSAPRSPSLELVFMTMSPLRSAAVRWTWPLISVGLVLLVSGAVMWLWFHHEWPLAELFLWIGIGVTALGAIFLQKTRGAR